jgi:sulfoxide reductase heme-binding subunit YedZ
MVSSIRLDRKRRIQLLRIAVHIGALIPLAILFWDWWSYQLVDPIREATLLTGKATIILLVLSLACTPLNIVFGWKAVLPLRRPLGLYAFMYGAIHFSIFVALDYGLDLQLIVEAIFEKRYAVVGLIAFILLIPLAITSNRYSQRKLGKRWKKLHQLVYAIGILGVIHYLWLVKNDYTQPLIFAVIVSVLLILRLKPVKTKVISTRRSLEKRRARRLQTQ